ncbi:MULTISPECIES: PAS domain-containing protein [unclassified Flavobacterium]|jgi:PAS domain S-box-containing protein|uniref:PAS domain-containing protein n=1 Tax=unclassified Flavobacterium TaxID=196869 RepID=UPI0025C6A8AB|nr:MULTISPECIES: PAS domain-containing protein [unclassified Flavobacterium]
MEHNSDELEIGKQSKEELLRLVQIYRKGIDENIISSITDVKGTIIYVNQNFCDVTKYSSDELVGQNHNIINSGYHPKEFFKNMWKIIGNGEVWHDEVKNKDKDGGYYWVDTVIVPVKDGKGKITQYLSLRTLITERKLLEEEKKEYVKSLEEMLFMISHKVRQPVANIIGLADQLTDLSSSSTDEVIGYIKKSAVSLDVFTRELSIFMSEVKNNNKKEIDNNRSLSKMVFRE